MTPGASLGVPVRTQLAPRLNLPQNTSSILRSSGSNQRKLTLRSLKRRNFLALVTAVLGTMPNSLAHASVKSETMSCGQSLICLLDQLVPANELALDLTKGTAIPETVARKSTLLENQLTELIYKETVIDVDAIRSYITEQIRVDFENALIVKTRGWYLANTEAALIVLAAQHRSV
ncbi:MAG: hypothetical protein CFH41_02040 [Alphaproteobacteria bacterium MarineAlpha11_Bin1]|nr:MAG: hypothetical protein CFH41_02040 [Alphaproteobacteria bacterium MarineAlpha11_Bin1]|tara:strand:- start:221 stop:748 length:528 start_codon:yes stop_codon:yes gene_type:complete